jgi:hypothetical protein
MQLGGPMSSRQLARATLTEVPALKGRADYRLMADGSTDPGIALRSAGTAKSKAGDP